MIAVDTSALMAVVLDEPEADRCQAVLEGHEDIRISAATLAEALIVAGRRGASGSMERLINSLGLTVEPVTAAFARRAAQAYGRWGKGAHPAGLNLGDCFAYALASDNRCPLLYVGDDFARTDIETARP